LVRRASPDRGLEWTGKREEGGFRSVMTSPQHYDVAIVGDLNKIRVMPLRNSAMRAEDLAKTGASFKAQIYGEYTAEFRNAISAFAHHNNLT